MDALMSKSWKLEKNHCMNGFIFHYIKRKNSNKLGTTGLHMTKRALFGWTNQVVCLHLTWRRQLFVYAYLIEAHNIVLFFLILFKIHTLLLGSKVKLRFSFSNKIWDDFLGVVWPQSLRNVLVFYLHFNNI